MTILSHQSQLPASEPNKGINTILPLVLSPKSNAGKRSKSPSHWSPSPDIFEDDTTFYITMQVPGIVPHSLKIYFEKSSVVLRGRKRRSFNLNPNVPSLAFECSITLPSAFKMDHHKVNCSNGIVDLTLDKETTERLVPIEIDFFN